jgi:peroxiredoxin Q/BCP
MIEVGQMAPSFSLSDQDGEVRSLEGARGGWVVLFFYPKDDTPGCTKEACGFRDALPHFGQLGAHIWGISADDASAHQKFARKFELNYPLLVDPDKQALEAYGAWVEKSMYGKKYMGVQRMTVLVDPEGKVARVWPKVSPEGHAEEVEAALRDLKGAKA